MASLAARCIASFNKAAAPPSTGGCAALCVALCTAAGVSIKIRFILICNLKMGCFSKIDLNLKMSYNVMKMQREEAI